MARRSAWRSSRLPAWPRQRNVPVKILGRGELTKKFTVNAHKFSASARSGIEGAGGTVQLIED